MPWEPLGQVDGPLGYLRLETHRFRMPNGRESDWDLLFAPDCVAVLAVTPDDEVLLVRQYRPGPGRLLDELPGGLIDPGEDPLTAAARELLEETGYQPDTIEVVGASWAGGSFSRRQYAALARGCRRVADPVFGQDEFCELVQVPLAQFRRTVRLGELTDVGSAYLALDHLGLL
jgi:ADP-ribose pyrophosphatase